MTQTAELTASDGEAIDSFGGSVSISGNTVVVGADDAAIGNNALQGAAYVFTESSSGWTDMTQTAKLTASDGASYDAFGCSVSVSGNTVLVGADRATAVANTSGGTSDVQNGPGAAYVFTEPVTGWTNMTQSAKLTASDGQDNDSFGDSLSLSSNTVVVAADAAAIDGNSQQGAAYVFAAPPAVTAVFDGFETGNFTALPWLLSTVGDGANWSVQSSTVYAGNYAAESGGVSSSASNSTLSLTLTLTSAGELSFWRKTVAASDSGSLIFEIDGTPELQLSGSMPWQQSYFWVSAGTHTFAWIYVNSGDPAGADSAFLDNVAFTPGTSLTVDGTGSGNVFSFDASGSSIVTALNGEIHAFASGEFTTYDFQGAGGSDDIASLTGSASGNSVSIYTRGTGQLTNSSAGYTVNVAGMASIVAIGHSGDTAQFFDAADNDTFYAYADYDPSGKQLAGMYGPGYSDAASGFGTNIGTNVGTASEGASDMAGFFDSPGNAADTPTRPRALARTSDSRPTAAAIWPFSTTRWATPPTMHTPITLAAANNWPVCSATDRPQLPLQRLAPQLTQPGRSWRAWVGGIWAMLRA
jgi:hypothetical protein